MEIVQKEKEKMVLPGELIGDFRRIHSEERDI